MNRAMMGYGVLAAAVVLLLVPARARAQHEHEHAPGKARQVPESMRVEHEHIHGALEAATKLEGAVGVAARELATILGPHFERENQVALPPLVHLPALAKGQVTPAMDQALELSDTLRRELPRMLEEHGRIAAAARRLESVAHEHGNAEVERLAHTLQLHARTEEEITYPAAIVVGDLIRLHRK